MSPATAQLLIDEVLPRIQSAVPRCVKTVGCEDVGELIQDTVASAAQMLEACEANGRPIYPASVAFYAIQRGKTGRRSYGATRTDALCASAQLDGNVSLTSMDEGIPTDDEGEGLTLHDVLGNNEEDPSQTAGRQIDWGELMETLGDREVAIIQSTISGGKLDDLARRFGISSPRINQIKKALGMRIKQIWGATAIADATRAPAWAATVNAVREQARCRHERAALAEA